MFLLDNCNKVIQESTNHHLASHYVLWTHLSRTKWLACCCDDHNCPKFPLVPSDFGSQYLRKDAAFVLANNWPQGQHLALITKSAWNCVDFSHWQVRNCAGISDRLIIVCSMESLARCWDGRKCPKSPLAHTKVGTTYLENICVRWLQNSSRKSQLTNQQVSLEHCFVLCYLLTLVDNS